jgi:hypothetical protein
LAALDESVHDLDELAPLLWRQVLDLLQAPLYAVIARPSASTLGGRRRLHSQQLIGADVQCLCQCRQQGGRRVLTLAFVVGDHPA